MKGNILVVDDSFEDLQAMKVMLEKEGFSVLTATNGAQAMDALDGLSFEAILVDVKIPTLSGYDVIRLLKERLEKKTKLLFVSIVPKKDVDTTFVDGFIQKPFDGRRFMGELKRVLKEK